MLSYQALLETVFKVQRPSLIASLKNMLPFPDDWNPTDEELVAACEAAARVMIEMEQAYEAAD